MKKLKKFLNSIFNRKKFSFVKDTKVEIVGLDYYGNTNLRIENIVEYNNEDYLFIIKYSESGMMIDIRNNDNSLRFKNTQLTASFHSGTDGWYIKLLDIHKLDNELLCRNGFGYLMMKFMLDTALKYEQLNNVCFKEIIGVIGTSSLDKPEESIPLYKKFDGYLYDENTNRYLVLDVEHCNIFDKKLYYSIQKK